MIAVIRQKLHVTVLRAATTETVLALFLLQGVHFNGTEVLGNSLRTAPGALNEAAAYIGSAAYADTRQTPLNYHGGEIVGHAVTVYYIW